MPIAHCILSHRIDKHGQNSAELIERWGKCSGLDSSEMTVTIVQAEEQMGKQYGVICTLHLPNLWSPKQVSSLQVGLAKAISEQFGLEMTDVLVMTSLIESGFVVEGGKEVSW